MTDALIGLIPTYGPWLLALIVGLGCFGVPIPSSLALIVAGGLVAAGDLSASAALGAGLAGAIAGDALGYMVGRFARGRIDAAASHGKVRQQTYDKASRLIRKWGGPSVFFTRWLLTPLGPAVNIAAGAGGLSPTLFFFGEIAGEMVWVLLYILAGYILAEQAATLLSLAANAATLGIAVLITAGLGIALFRRLRVPASEG